MLETNDCEGSELAVSKHSEEMARLNSRFETFWAQHGEMLVWRLWVQKYPDQVQYDAVATMPATQEVEIEGEDVVGMSAGHTQEKSGSDRKVEANCAEDQGGRLFETSPQPLSADGDSGFSLPPSDQDVAECGSMAEGSGHTCSDLSKMKLHPGQSSSVLSEEGDRSGGKSLHNRDEAFTGETSPGADASASECSTAPSQTSSEQLSEMSETHVKKNIVQSDSSDQLSHEKLVESVDCHSQIPQSVDTSKESEMCCAHSEVAMDQDSIPNTHLIGFNQAIHSTLCRVKEGEAAGENVEEGEDNHNKRRTTVSQETADTVSMMHSYAGGVSCSNKRDKQADHEGDGDSTDNPVRQ